MIRFKNHNSSGFTFLEVIFSIIIVATLGLSLMSLLQQSLTTVSSYSQRIARCFLLKNAIISAHEAESKNQKPPEEIVVQNPPTKITCVSKKPHEKSSLAAIKNIIIQLFEAKPTGGDRTVERLIVIKYAPPAKDKKEAPKK